MKKFLSFLVGCLVFTNAFAFDYTGQPNDIWKRVSTSIFPTTATDEIGSAGAPLAKIYVTDFDVAGTCTGCGVATFIGHTDTPANYTGSALKVVRVNAGGTALEFSAAGSGDMVGANNLSDVADAATSLSTIGGIGAATVDSLTNKTIDADGVGNSITNIENADIKAGAGIVLSKLATDPLARANHTGTQLAATVSDFASAVGSSISTFTNKTLDADGAGNSITNIENADIKVGAAIDSAKIHDGTVSNTEFGYLNNVSSAIQTQLDSKMATSTYDPTSVAGDSFLIANFPFPKIGTPTTIDTLGESMDFVMSAGSSGENYISDAGGLTYDVAAGSGYIRISDDHSAGLRAIEWSAASGETIVADTVEYVGVEYNAGSPQLVFKASDTWNMHDEFPLGLVVNEDSALHVFNNPQFYANATGHMMERLYETEPFMYAERIGGLVTGETGTRNLTVSAGEIYDRVTEFAIGAIDTSGADTFDAYYDDGGTGWTLATAQTQWNNTQYDDESGTLADLTNNRYGSHWIYVDLEDGSLISVYGTDNETSQATAEASSERTSLPLRIQTHCKLIAKLIFQKSAGTADTIVSKLLSNGGSGVAITDHGNLSGLADDDHTQYLLADGTRALGGAWDMGSQATTNVNIDSGVITGITDLAVADGGTGASTLGDGFVLLGSGTNAITPLDVTAKGSLLAGDGTTDPVALAVGTDGFVLTADSAEGAGIKWASAGGAGATVALDNLSGVAINTSLISDTAGLDDLGSSALFWDSIYLKNTINFEGASDDAWQTTFIITDTTASDKSIVFPDLAGTVGLSANTLDFFSATSSAELATVLSDESGTGVVAYTTSPVFTTPTIGVATGTSLNLQADSNQIVLDSDAGAGVTTTITDSATAGRTITLPDADGTVAITGNTLGDFSATSSAQLAGVLSDESGTGLVAYTTSPTLTTPQIGVATGTSLNLTADSNQIVLDSDAGGGVTTTLTDSATAARTATFQDASGTIALTGNSLNDFANTTSAQLASVITDETGTGILAYATAPTFTGFTGNGVVDMGAATSLEIPSATSNILDAAGEIAIDTDGDNSTVIQGVFEGFDGTAVVNYFGSEGYPSTDNDVLAYDSGTNKVTWQAQAGGGGGDDPREWVNVCAAGCSYTTVKGAVDDSKVAIAVIGSVTDGTDITFASATQIYVKGGVTWTLSSDVQFLGNVQLHLFGDGNTSELQFVLTTGNLKPAGMNMFIDKMYIDHNSTCDQCGINGFNNSLLKISNSKIDVNRDHAIGGLGDGDYLINSTVNGTSTFVNDVVRARAGSRVTGIFFDGSFAATTPLLDTTSADSIYAFLTVDGSYRIPVGASPVIGVRGESTSDNPVLEADGTDEGIMVIAAHRIGGGETTDKNKSIITNSSWTSSATENTGNEIVFGNNYMLPGGILDHSGDNGVIVGNHLDDIDIIASGSDRNIVVGNFFDDAIRIASGAVDNIFIGGIVDGTITDSGTDTVWIGVEGMDNITHGNYQLAKGDDNESEGLTRLATVDANATGIGACLVISTDGNYDEADADASTTAPCTAMALEAGTGAGLKVLLQGIIRQDTLFNFTLGDGVSNLVYLHTTTGAVTQTAPVGAGDQVQIVGYVIDADTMYFDPSLEIDVVP